MFQFCRIFQFILIPFTLQEDDVFTCDKFQMDVSNCYSGVSISGLVTEAPEGERTQEQKEKLKKVIFFFSPPVELQSRIVDRYFAGQLRGRCRRHREMENEFILPIITDLFSVQGYSHFYQPACVSAGRLSHGHLSQNG